jgi:hypothetical protein
LLAFARFYPLPIFPSQHQSRFNSSREFQNRQPGTYAPGNGQKLTANEATGAGSPLQHMDMIKKALPTVVVALVVIAVVFRIAKVRTIVTGA